MHRRTILLGGAASAMLAAVPVRAQRPGRAYRVGVLLATGGQAAEGYLQALRERLSTHGFVDGRNLSLAPFFSTQSLQDARDVVAQKPDAILSLGTYLTQAVQAATSSVPTVFCWVADPVHAGLMTNLARPGGNMTGVTSRSFELLAKRLELVRELLPSAKRVAVASHVWGRRARATGRHFVRHAGHAHNGRRSPCDRASRGARPRFFPTSRP